MVDLFEGFKSFTSFIEDEFIEDRLFDYQYTLSKEAFEQFFGNLAVPLDYDDLPKSLKYVKGLSYFKIQHGFDKLIFSNDLISNIFLLEYSYTDGLEYVKSDLSFEEHIIA